MIRYTTKTILGALLLVAHYFCPATVSAETLAAGNYSTIHQFTGVPDGKQPAAGLVGASNGLLYGTTVYGGRRTDLCPDGCGTIFKVEADKSVTVVHEFDSTGQGGFWPYASLLVGSDSQLYGTTSTGGAFGWGTVFRISNDGTLETVHSFNGIDGAAPTGKLLELADGFLYGTTAAGGANFFPTNTQCGTVFRMDPNSGQTTTLFDFSLSPSQGCVPRAGLALGVDGKLYGATLEGGTVISNGQTNMGVVFRIAPSGSNFEVILQLTPQYGRYMLGEMTRGRDGALYGAMEINGQNDAGTVFRLPSSGTYAVIHSFSGSVDGSLSDGRSPIGALTLGKRGLLYGTAMGGGLYGCGVVYRINPKGSLKVIQSFEGCLPDHTADGKEPEAPVHIDSAGVIWGTTATGGTADAGTIFRIGRR